MIESKHINKIIAGAIITALLFCVWIIYSADGAYESTYIPEYQKRLFNGEIAAIDIQVDSKDWQAILDNPEKELIKILYEYEGVLNNAAETLSPALIANYAFELAKEFNRFYQEIQILREENVQNRDLRLQIAENCAEKIKIAMQLLGIEVPDRM